MSKRWMKFNRKCYDENAVMPIKNIGVFIWDKKQNTIIQNWIKIYANNDPPIIKTIENEIQNKISNYKVFVAPKDANDASDEQEEILPITNQNLFEILCQKKIDTIYLVQSTENE